MDDGQPTLLLTRPEPQSKAFLALCEKRVGHQISAVISPVIDIEPLGEPPDLDGFETVILTSGNGVRRLAADLADRTVVTVGEQTAALAREFGAEARALGQDVDDFLNRAGTIRGPALFCRGVHSRGDLAPRLAALGLEVTEAVVYDQKSRPLSPDARTLLSARTPLIAPVFSPRSAALLSRYPINAPFLVLAISDAVKTAWKSGGDIRVAEAPTQAAMCDLVARAL